MTLYHPGAGAFAYRPSTEDNSQYASEIYMQNSSFLNFAM